MPSGGAKENISGLSCAVPPYNDRNLAPVYSDTTIQHCFGTCDYDGSCASAVTPPNYTFQVDMSQSGYAATAVPYLRGSWDWGGPGDMMADANINQDVINILNFYKLCIRNHTYFG